MKIGILAFGSVIDDLGEEIGGVISGDPITVETPLRIEYGRFSLSHGGAEPYLEFTNRLAKGACWNARGGRDPRDRSWLRALV